MGRDRRQDIMQAVEKLFSDRRLHEVTLEDVAREARIGKGTIYRHFRDKEDLFVQTATSGFDQLCELLTRKVPGEASFQEQLLSVCRQISEFYRRRRPWFRMMQSEDARMSLCRGALRRRWTQQQEKLLSAVAQVLQRGVDEGRLREGISTEVLSSYLLGMLRTRARRLARAPESAGSFEVMVELFLNGAGLG